jgi:hypothetical protein
MLFIEAAKPDIHCMNRNAFLFSTHFCVLLVVVLTPLIEIRAQYRPGGGGGATVSGDQGRITIELPMKTPVYTATVQVYLGENQVATRSLKKDSVADKARIVDIRNLKEGLYTLKVESPGMPDMLQQVYVRNERDPVKVYIDYPESMRQMGAPGMASPDGTTGSAGLNELLLRLERLEERVTVVEMKKQPKTSKRTRGAKPKPVVEEQPETTNPDAEVEPVKVEVKKGRKPKKANTRAKPAAADTTDGAGSF